MGPDPRLRAPTEAASVRELSWRCENRCFRLTPSTSRLKLVWSRQSRWFRLEPRDLYMPEVIAVHPEGDIDAFEITSLANRTDRDPSRNMLCRRCIWRHSELNVPRKRRVLGYFGLGRLNAEFRDARHVDAEQVIEQSALVLAKWSHCRRLCHQSITPKVANAYASIHDSPLDLQDASTDHSAHLKLALNIAEVHDDLADYSVS